jgi:hypothetical protein
MTEKEEEKKFHMVMIKMPIELYDKLKKAAKSNRRSVGAQAIIILEDDLK